MGIQSIILLNTESSTTSLLCKHHQKKAPKNCFWINVISDHQWSYSYLLCYSPADATSILKQCQLSKQMLLFYQRLLAIILLNDYIWHGWLQPERIQKFARPRFTTALLPLYKGQGVTLCKQQAGKVMHEGNNPLWFGRKISLGNAGWLWSLRVA